MRSLEEYRDEERDEAEQDEAEKKAERREQLRRWFRMQRGTGKDGEGLGYDE